LTSESHVSLSRDAFLC